MATATAKRNSGKPSLATVDVPAVVGNVNEYIGRTVELIPTDIMDVVDARVAPVDVDEVLENLSDLKDIQKQNILVKPNPTAQNGDPRFIVVDGRRRWTWFKTKFNGDKSRNVKANPDVRVRAYIMPNAEGKNKADLIDTLTHAYTTNADSKQMTPLDKAHTFRTLRSYGLDNAEAAKAMGGFGATWATVLNSVGKFIDRAKEKNPKASGYDAVAQKVITALEADEIDAWTVNDLSTLKDDAILRVFDAMDKADRNRKSLIGEAKVDPSIHAAKAAEKQAIADKKAAAKQAAKDEKAAAKLQKQQQTGKEDRRGKGSKSSDANKARTSSEIRAAFAELYGKNFPSQIVMFAGVMRDFIANKAQHNKLYRALWECAGLEPESAPTFATIQANAASSSPAKGGATETAKAKMTQAATIKA